MNNSEKSNLREAPEATEENTEQAIARYNRWLMVFTGVLAVVGLIQIGFLIHADQIAAESARAAKQSAEAARLSVDSTINAERPNMLVSEYKIKNLRSANPSSKIVADYRITNYGRSPAFIKRTCVEIVISDGKIPPTPQYKFIKPSVIIIGPQLSLTSDDARMTIPIEQRQAVINGVKKLYVFGFVDYTDVFKRPHKSSFLYRYRVGKNEAADEIIAVGPEAYWKTN